MKTQVGFNGKRLKAARLYRGLTISEEAKMSDISKQAISQFENGKTEPRLETLMKIMQVLRFPREYFYENPEDKVVIGDTYFRSLSSTSNKERLAQIECVKLLVAIYRGIDEYIAFPELNLYTVPEDFDFDIEALAKNVRKFWNIGNDRILNLVSILEKNGVIVSTRFTNGNKIDAYSQIENINDKIIAVIILGDDKENAFRRNFSVAHELGHLLLDDFYDIEGMSKIEYKEMEDTMNRFAGALLVPEELYRMDLQTNAKTELNFYIQMKKKYGVSAAALIVRARQLEEITINQYQYLMKQLSQKGYRKCEPYDKETKQMQPRYLKEAMRMIIEEDKVTGTEFLEVVSEKGVSVSEEIVENILNLDEGYLRMNDSSGEIVALERR
ncbi:ImmA/IrrE family metallo-endopeptidase [Agathobacter rectalis]|uniref:ImmA/IrrE family metallo-endopeptidase n=1 Tax=Agathobacter rectalis TaxID=39491 RepID=A0A414HRI6_9FIRM|nr:XRE family transcriptional regulator [Agathobacter rectalis]RHD89898.1 ImmA/IrrE family metallo-endopeptidase [Agathobacter rectalis]